MKSRPPRPALPLTFGLLLFAPHLARAAQNPPPPVQVDPVAATSPGLEPEIDADGTSRNTGRTVTPMVAPIPFKNTQLGWGLMAMGGLIHRFDRDTTIKPSTGMLGGFYTENGSWGVMALENARLAADRWRLRLLLAHPEVRYDFYGIGQDAGNAGRSIGIQQNMTMITAAALRRVAHGVYLGVTALSMHSTIALRDSASLGPLPQLADTAAMDLFAAGVQAEADTRNDDYWPVRGTLARLRAFFFLDALGGTRTFQRYVLSWSWYAPVRGEQLVAATNLNVCAANGGTPFWAVCSIGFGRGGLRGYTQGRYRDSVMTTVQAELRYHTTGRLGATAFAGFGQVAPTASDIVNAEALLAGGFGLRYQLTQKYPMHLRLDFAWGRDGPLFYFGVGELF
ncbi:MAG: BamA/TamA family outer membrane protein [Hyphomicrobiaceae bacterium]|nr:BamA/TamA family outer membrane protein [Hyphomicrobiaceae bacterium]